MKLVVDTDPGVDDALALAMLSQADLRIEAITTVAGNATLEEVNRNASYLAEKMGQSTPVYSGSDSPLKRELRTASSHGEAGLGAITSNPKPKVSGDAVGAMIDLAGSGRTLLCLGPLTNLARALDRDSELLDRYGRVIIMGGALKERGNVNDYAEFNIWQDPEAVEKVLEKNSEVVFVPLSVCRRIRISSEFFESFNSWIRPLTEPYLNYYQQNVGFEGAVMYDPVAALLSFEGFRGRIKEEGASIDKSRDDSQVGGISFSTESGNSRNTIKYYHKIFSDSKERIKDLLKMADENLGKETR